jgi:CheY-like chemotaxis protein/anti-sigma regulatory factor (Ser/Thr protein kinase)
MKAVVERALELTRPALAQHASPVAVDLPEAPLLVDGDAVRLVQVLSNLLNNAAKFTPADGRIGLRLRESDGWVEAVVDDSGAGIPAQLLPHVFDLFTQGEQGMDRHAGGLGLGLAIVKTLVGLHGGEVSAHSEGPGRGARFTVRLPAAAADAAPAASPHVDTAGPPRGGRILLVDDNRDAAETLRVLLADVGYAVCVASDGPSALAALDGFLPELALLDIGLPGMDGYELAGRLRADPRLRARPPLRLVALTGYGREPDRARALATHFDEHLVKPVQAQHLVATLARLLDVTPPQAPV